MSMFRKVALTIGAIFLISLVIIVMTGRLVPFLNELWNWVFSTLFRMTNVPPSPFGS